MFSTLEKNIVFVPNLLEIQWYNVISHTEHTCYLNKGGQRYSKRNVGMRSDLIEQYPALTEARFQDYKE